MTFDRIAGASDRRTVLHALGFTEPLDVATLETEWISRLAHEKRTRSVDLEADEEVARDLLRAIRAPDNQRMVPSAANVNRAPPPPLFTRPAHELRMEPAELQEAVVTHELSFALRGISSEFFAVDHDTGNVVPTPSLPPTLAAASHSVLPVVGALNSLDAIAAFRYLGVAQSLIKSATAEFVAEQQTRFTMRAAALAGEALSRRFPLARFIADIQVASVPIFRLASVFRSMQFELRTGDAVLAELLTRHTRSAGCTDEERLLADLMQCAAAPYVDILDRWLYEGRLQDPFGEFFILEHASVDKLGDDGSSKDSGSDLQRFVARFQRRPAEKGGAGPWFSRKISNAVFSTGRLVHLLKECGAPLLPRPTGDAPRIIWGAWEQMSRAILMAHEAAGRAVVRLLVEKHQLERRFESVRAFFLHGRGDWLNNFLDAAQHMLFAKANEVKQHSLDVVLQSEIAKACPGDPHHVDFGCSLSPHPLYQLVALLNQRRTALSPRLMIADQASFAQWDCVELLQLEMNVPWPLPLVFNDVFCLQLNCIFRLLLWCRICERALVAGWSRTSYLPPPALVARVQLTQFIRQFQFYASHSVLEPMWHALTQKVASLESVDDIGNEGQRFMRRAFEALTMRSENGFKALTTILVLIKRFGDLGIASQHLTSRDPVIEKAQVYTTKFHLFLAQLGDPAKMGASYPSIVPLLTWLDFSGFFGREKIYKLHPVGAVALRLVEDAKHRAGGVTDEDDSEPASA